MLQQLADDLAQHLARSGSQKTYLFGSIFSRTWAGHLAANYPKLRLHNVQQQVVGQVFVAQPQQPQALPNLEVHQVWQDCRTLGISSTALI